MKIGQTIIYNKKEYKIVKRFSIDDMTPYCDIENEKGVLKAIPETSLKTKKKD